MPPRTRKKAPVPISTPGDPITTHVPPSALRPNPANPRFIRDDRFADLVHAMASDPAMLDARPLLALPDGTVIGGNMRLRAALHLEMESIPVQYWDIDEATQRQWMLRDNNGFGEWQEDAVAELIYKMTEDGEDTRATGFASTEVDALLEQVGSIEPPGEFPQTNPETAYRCPKCGYEWNGDPQPGDALAEPEPDA